MRTFAKSTLAEVILLRFCCQFIQNIKENGPKHIHSRDYILHSVKMQLLIRIFTLKEDTNYTLEDFIIRVSLYHVKLYKKYTTK